MNDKKNLDRLFQEKFKDFEVEPDEQIWKNIESALQNKKKKRRVIPIWYRLSGVAAALILGIFILDSVFDSDVNILENGVVIEENNPKSPEKNNEIVTETNSSSAIDKERSGETANDNRLNSEKTQLEGNSIIKSNNEKIAVEDKLGKIQGNDAADKIANSQNAVAVPSKKNPKKFRANPKSGIAIESGNAVAEKSGKTSREAILENRKNNVTNRKNQASEKSNVEQNNTSIASSGNSNNSKKSDSEKTKSIENNLKETNSSIANQNEQNKIIPNSAVNPLQTKSPFDAPLTAEDKKLDSTAIATVVPNALEELLKENEKEKNSIAETKLNRWQVTPNVAPIYFGSTSNGSPIDQQLSNNSKTYDKNLSYGVGVKYAVTKKLNVRTGVNKLTLGYDTNDVVFSAGLESRGFENLSTSGNAANIQVISSDASMGLLPFETSLQGMKEGSISQTMGYIEVPMELSYKLLDRKFGINLIGGISTLFLNENEVYIASTDLSTSLGKANNLNDVHFSSNLGVGFKYSFWKAFEFNFEPTFKYQINTFSKNAGDFKPYFLGLYSGVSFKF